MSELSENAEADGVDKTKEDEVDKDSKALQEENDEDVGEDDDASYDDDDGDDASYDDDDDDSSEELGLAALLGPEIKDTADDMVDFVPEDDEDEDDFDDEEEEIRRGKKQKIKR